MEEDPMEFLAEKRAQLQSMQAAQELASLQTSMAIAVKERVCPNNPRKFIFEPY
jgi:hypothetical protein